jgi:hypothetical protein
MIYDPLSVRLQQSEPRSGPSTSNAAFQKHSTTRLKIPSSLRLTKFIRRVETAMFNW